MFPDAGRLGATPIKHIVIIDVLTIAIGFVLRAVAGAVVLNVEMSHWLFVCTILLALFIALAAYATGASKDPGAIIAGGLAGSLADSLVGATLQERRWCDRCAQSTERRVHSFGERTRIVGPHALDIAAVQAALAADGLDAWLLYDFRGINSIARDVTGVSLQGGHLATRRWSSSPRALRTTRATISCARRSRRWQRSRYGSSRRPTGCRRARSRSRPMRFSSTGSATAS